MYFGYDYYEKYKRTIILDINKKGIQIVTVKAFAKFEGFVFMKKMRISLVKIKNKMIIILIDFV